MTQRLGSWLTRLVLAAPPGIVESPHPLLLGLLVLLSGLVLVFEGGRAGPESVERALPPALVFAWGLFLAAGGALLVVGVLGRGFLGRRRALGLERAGSTLLAPVALIYGVVLLEQVGVRAAIAAGLSIAFGLGSVIHAYTRRQELWARLLARQIQRDLRSGL